LIYNKKYKTFGMKEIITYLFYCNNERAETGIGGPKDNGFETDNV
jgi:hypothetical protein